MSEVVQVDIELLGRQFTVGTPLSERDALLQAVQLVSEKIATIKGHGRIVDADKIAIMAALNIAHDLLKTKVGGGLEMAEFQRRIKSMSEAADTALQQSRHSLS